MSRGFMCQPTPMHKYVCPPSLDGCTCMKGNSAGTLPFQYMDDPNLRVLLSAFGLPFLGQGIKASTRESSGCTAHLSFSETPGTIPRPW